MEKQYIDIIVDIIKIIIAGGVGGYLASKYALKEFRDRVKYQAKHSDLLEQRKALQELQKILPIIYRDIHMNWEMPDDSPISMDEHIDELHQIINNARALCLRDDKSLRLVEDVRRILALDVRSIKKSGGEMPGERIGSLQIRLEERIKDITELVYE